MAQFRHSARFPKKSVSRRLRGDAREQHFDRDIAAELGIARTEDHAHAAAADHIADHVAPKAIAGPWLAP
jgi:hypothetical protein